MYNTPMPEKTFDAGMIDFNLRRMTAQEAAQRGIPINLQKFIADYRQYPCNIALSFPDGVKWFSPDQEWFFKSVMPDPEKVAQLKKSDTLILSGSGLSAYRFQESDSEIDAQDREYLTTSQDVVRSLLGQGKWVLGICFGGQMAVHAVGGRIGRLPDNNGNAVTEAGWLEHQLTEAGKKDEVFNILPEHFSAPHLHHDFVAELPAVGTLIQTEHGSITVTRAEVLATRKGYLGRNGIELPEITYTHASVIKFHNGGTLYQVQFHPEMARSFQKVNFLVQQNAGIADEKKMGQEYYRRALEVPENADLRVVKVITRFTELARRHLEEQGQQFVDAVIARDLNQYLLP